MNIIFFDKTLNCQWQRQVEYIILTVKEKDMDGKEGALMDKYDKMTALYSRLSVGEEVRKVNA
ncbi:hypothetical protein LJC32_02290 [Oscillospiraceae bacterium OttesenSCG-928-F05]|nr:hypothetical protein [Oscillospiraceae bacterium OttesenSCG-928-F05]